MNGIGNWSNPGPGSSYRPYRLGPRAITGLSGDPRWPSAWRGGGFATPFDDWGQAGLGDAMNAPGWSTPFDSPYPGRNAPWKSTLDVSAVPVPGIGGVDSNSMKRLSNTMQPTVNPGFIFQKPTETSRHVRYNNAPVYVQTMYETPQNPWPLYPSNRGSFKGPYGEHKLPYYVQSMTAHAVKAPGWPFLRTTNTGIVGAHIRDISRWALPSPSFVQARKRYATPAVRNRVDTFNPRAQEVIRKGPYDFRQDRNRRELLVSRPLI